ncbi:MAG: cob(I)yrinic acid a,c-diamide adenosyltransferase, partial [Caldilineaceae bacterium]
AVYGTVDELNSQIGVALAAGLAPEVATALVRVQNELFDLGSDLCFLEEDKQKWPLPQIELRHINALEVAIDQMQAVVGPLENFILPGGSLGAAQLHVARTICRRAERDATTLAREEGIGANVIPYLNRLSDALFVMSRFENHARGVPEPLWKPNAT